MPKTTRRTTTPRGPQPPKKLSPQAVLGQKGINLIERVVLEMGCRWNPTGALDVGIDGIIELCDRATSAPLNTVLHVQSKATESAWERETSEGFDYTCRPKDLEYWLQGNAPVLLIVSRPSAGEAYWISVKDHFQDPARRDTRRAHFDKQRDRFAPDAYSRLLEIADRRDTGLYLAPAPRTEQLVSNLLEVASFAPRLYIAETTLRRRQDIWAAFRNLELSCPSEWLLTDKRLVSFHDLTTYPWDQVCDRGTVEDFDVSEWAFAPEPERRREFVQLLNGALREKLFPEVRFWNSEKMYAFTATKDLRRRTIQYTGGLRPGRRTVFEVYTRKHGTETYTYYRHMAMQAQFRLYGDRWYLEITPTYRFTWDGRGLHRRHVELLQGIKRLERNDAVRQQLLLWANYLQRDGDLLRSPYPYLSFGQLSEFTLDVGIEDRAWQRQDTEPDTSESDPLTAVQTAMEFETV